MARDAGKQLVVLIDEHRVVAAAPGDDAPVAIDLPGRWSDQKPELLGGLLKEGLGASRLALGRVVVGVPVSWVLTQHLSVPTHDPAATAGAVKLRVNRDYATDAGELVADYTTHRGAVGNEVLIGVTTRSKVRRLNQALEFAGLKAKAIHVTAQACIEPELIDAAVVRVQPPMAELALVREGRTIGLRSLCETLEGDDPASTARAIGSSLASDPEVTAAPNRLILTTDPAAGIDSRQVLSRLNGLAAGSATLHEVSPIDALRMRAGDDDLLDLLRCRASQESRSAWTLMQKVGMTAAVVVMMALLGVGGTWWSRAHRLSNLQARTMQIQPEAEALGRVKERLDASAPWFDKRVDMLSCMLILTECVPKQGGLWLAEFRLNADHSGTLQGRTEARGTMLEFLRAMQASDALTDVALRDSSESQNGKREVRFEIAFRFTAGGRAR